MALIPHNRNLLLWFFKFLIIKKGLQENSTFLSSGAIFHCQKISGWSRALAHWHLSAFLPKTIPPGPCFRCWQNGRWARKCLPPGIASNLRPSWGVPHGSQIVHQQPLLASSGHQPWEHPQMLLPRLFWLGPWRLTMPKTAKAPWNILNAKFKVTLAMKDKSIPFLINAVAHQDIKFKSCKKYY